MLCERIVPNSILAQFESRWEYRYDRETFCPHCSGTAECYVEGCNNTATKALEHVYNEQRNDICLCEDHTSKVFAFREVANRFDFAGPN